MTSTYQTRKAIKLFVLDESARSLITLSDVAKIRLSPTPAPGSIILKGDLNDHYPVNDAGAYVVTWTTEPTARLGWIAFEAIVMTRKDADGNVVTSYYYRLTDGVDQYYWTGAAWAVASTQWNTEAEINDGLASWSHSKLGVVVNPRTSDEAITPEVRSLKFAYDVRIDYLRDLVLSFTDLLATLRTWRQHTLITEASGLTLNLASTYPLDLDVTITGILAVYNHDDDPNHAVDLFSSYNPTTKVVTLTGPIAAGKRVWIDYEFAPRIAFATDVDYLELSAVPAIWIEDMNITTTRGFHRDYVLRRDTNVAYRWTDTRVGDVELMMSIEATNPDDHLRLSGQVEEFFAKVKQLRAIGLDEPFDITIEGMYSSRSGVDVKGRLSSRYRLRIRNALLAASVEQLFGIQQFKLGITIPGVPFGP